MPDIDDFDGNSASRLVQSNGYDGVGAAFADDNAVSERLLVFRESI